MVPAESHKLNDAGSNPVPATKKVRDTLQTSMESIKKIGVQ